MILERSSFVWFLTGFLAREGCLPFTVFHMTSHLNTDSMYSRKQNKTYNSQLSYTLVSQRYMYLMSVGIAIECAILICSNQKFSTGSSQFHNILVETRPTARNKHSQESWEYVHPVLFIFTLIALNLNPACCFEICTLL